MPIPIGAGTGAYLRHPDMENYRLSGERVTLIGTHVTLDEVASPTFLGIRQRDFDALIRCDVTVSNGEGGITLYMDEGHHYDPRDPRNRGEIRSR